MNAETYAGMTKEERRLRMSRLRLMLDTVESDGFAEGTLANLDAAHAADELAKALRREMEVISGA